MLLLSMVYLSMEPKKGGGQMLSNPLQMLKFKMLNIGMVMLRLNIDGLYSLFLSLSFLSFLSFLSPTFPPHHFLFLTPFPPFPPSSSSRHYHNPQLGHENVPTEDTLLAFAMDGFPIYGPVSDEELGELDGCNGRKVNGRFDFFC